MHTLCILSSVHMLLLNQALFPLSSLPYTYVFYLDNDRVTFLAARGIPGFLIFANI